MKRVINNNYIVMYYKKYCLYVFLYNYYFG